MVAKSSDCNKTACGDKQFKGVRQRSWGKWVSEIRLPNTRARLWLGSYSTAEQAARAFDVAVVCLRGRSAALNFPESPPAYAPLGLPHHQIRELAAASAAAHTCPSSPTAQPGSDLAMPSEGTPSIPAALSPDSMSEELDTAASEESSSSQLAAAGSSEASAMKGEVPRWDEVKGWADELQRELLMKSDWEAPYLWGSSAFDSWSTPCAELQLPVDHYDNDDMLASMADPLWSLWSL